jgi:hypothetical protein
VHPAGDEPRGLERLIIRVHLRSFAAKLLFLG